MGSISRTKGLLLCACAAFVPLSLAAEKFDARSRVEAVTLYPQGALITRAATVQLPQGTHELAFFDIPAANQDAKPDRLQAIVTGAQIGPVLIRSEQANGRDLGLSDAAIKARDVAEALEVQLLQAERGERALAEEIAAGQDALNFILALEAPTGAGASDIIAFTQAIQTQSLETRLAMQAAAVRIQEARDAKAEIQAALTRAQADLAKLLTTSEYRNKITLQVAVEQAGAVDVEFTYFVQNAGWQPTYRADVDTVTQSLTLERRMAAIQNTGEPWIDVALSFATDQPSRQSAPSQVTPHIRRITDPSEIKQSKTVRMKAESLRMFAADETQSELATSGFVQELQARRYGLNLTYDYAQPATMYASSGAITEFALEELTFTPDLYVRAVPLYDDRGYLVADVTNTGGEMILSGSMQLLRDGALVGETVLPAQAEGSMFELGFGAIDGIRVARTILDRNEANTGLISKSNDRVSQVRLLVENLTSRAWPVELIDRVSVSEQEDLSVEWSAKPTPDVQNLDDLRGVLAWRMDLEAGEVADVTLEERLRWPEGYRLR